MTNNRIFYRSLVVPQPTAAAYGIRRHRREVEKEQHKGNLCTWEDEGGNLAASESHPIARRAAGA